MKNSISPATQWVCCRLQTFTYSLLSYVKFWHDFNVEVSPRTRPQSSTVLPPKQMYLSFAGSVIDREIMIMRDDEVNITCHAIGASPAANLSWRINNKLVNFPSTYSSLKNKEGTFDAVSTIRFRPEPEDKEVECVSTFSGSGEEQVVHGTLLLNDKPIFQNIPILWAIISSGVASLLITLNCICCLRRKFSASQSTNSRTCEDSDVSLDYFAPDIFTTTPDNALKKLENDNARKCPGPSRLQLHRTITTTEECKYANYNTDNEELNLPEISVNTDQPLYANYDIDAEPQKCKFPRISVIPETPKDNEYATDIIQSGFSKIQTITDYPEDLEYDELK